MPFTPDEFFAVFAAYNQAIGPVYQVAYALAAGVVVMIAARRAAAMRAALGFLALLWAWNGAAYFLLFFSRINAAAYGFAALFGLQAILLVRAAIVATDPPPREWTMVRMTGAILIVYSMAVYEQLGVLFGHGWPHGPQFGTAPCPTTIFTIGLLMLAMHRSPAVLLVVPLIWSAIGATAAFLLSMPEDYGLLVAGLCGAVWLAAPILRRTA